MKNSVQNPLNFKKSTVTRLNPAAAGRAKGRHLGMSITTFTSRGL